MLSQEFSRSQIQDSPNCSLARDFLSWREQASQRPNPVWDTGAGGQSLAKELLANQESSATRNREDIVPFPAKFAAKLRVFLAERRTGNITINVRVGEILGWRFEEMEQNR